jgi:hypothetical protein
MDPLNEFQQKEAEKLSSWFSGIYATKEAKVHATDSMVSTSQRSSVATETHEMGFVPTPHVPVAESKASSIPNGDVDLSDYYTKKEVDELLEKYYTKEEIDDKFEEYYTKEEIDTKFEEYYTKEEIDNLLDKYATKEWVTNELSNLENSIKEWVEKQKFVKEDNFAEVFFRTVLGNPENRVELQRNIIESNQFDYNIEDALNSLTIEAQCVEGNVEVTLDNTWVGATFKG